MASFSLAIQGGSQVPKTELELPEMATQIFQAVLKRHKISNCYIYSFSFCLVLSYGKGKSLLTDKLGRIVGRGGFAGVMQM